MTSIRRRRRVTGLALSVGLVASACGLGGGPALSSEEEALAALAESLTGPVRWEVSLDLALDYAELGAIAESMGKDAPSPGDADFQEFEEVAQITDGSALFGAVGDDRSYRVGLSHLGTPWAELAIDYSGAPYADDLDLDPNDPLAFFDIAPFAFGLYGRFDADAFIAAYGDVEGMDADAFREGMQEARDEAAAELGATYPELLDVALAALDGRWAGIAGEIAPARMFEAMGLDRETFAAMIEEAGDQFPNFSQPAIPAGVWTQWLDTALTIRDFTRDDEGRTVATVDFHVGPAYDAFEDIVKEYDTTGQAAAALTLMGNPVSDAPDILDIATIAFNDDLDVVSIRIDAFAIAAATMDIASDYAPGEDEVLELRDMLSQIQTSRADIVVALSDHRSVGSQVPTDATTIDWDTIIGIAQAEGAFDDALYGSGFGDQTDFARPDLPSEDAILSALRNGAVAQETYFTEHGEYTDDDMILADQYGWDAFWDLPVWLGWADATRYCLEGYAPDTDTNWSFQSDLGELLPEPCPPFEQA